MVLGVTQVSIIPTSVTHWPRALRVVRFIPVSPSAVLAKVSASHSTSKHQQVRAGLCWIPEIAHLIRQHNDANVLVMPGRFIDNNMARKIMDEFFTATFEGGRHQKRVDKIPVQK